MAIVSISGVSRILTAVAVLVLGAADTAIAISYRFDLVARTVDDAAGVTGLGVGDPLTIEIGFDDNPVDQIPQLATRGNYLVRQLSYSFPTGAFIGSIDDDLDAWVTIFANDPDRDAMSFTLPRMSLGGVFAGTPATLSYGSQIALALQDDHGVWLQNDSLPNAFLELGAYETNSQNQMRLTVGSAPMARINTTLVGIVVIPEPSTASLALTGLLVIAACRRPSG